VTVVGGDGGGRGDGGGLTLASGGANHSRSGGATLASGHVASDGGRSGDVRVSTGRAGLQGDDGKALRLAATAHALVRQPFFSVYLFPRIRPSSLLWTVGFARL
jgi:hypothetical protein